MRILTIAQAAEYLSILKATLDIWRTRSAGFGPRAAKIGGCLNDAVFPTHNGTWQQVNNVERRWRQIRADTGLGWVTPDTFRKTVATPICERVDTDTASQHLGHSFPAITREFYISKPAIGADVAHVPGGTG